MVIVTQIIITTLSTTLIEKPTEKKTDHRNVYQKMHKNKDVIYEVNNDKTKILHYFNFFSRFFCYFYRQKIVPQFSFHYTLFHFKIPELCA